MKRIDLATVEAVVFLASNRNEDGSYRSVQADQIEEAVGCPPRYIEPNLQRLVHAGLIKGKRGPTGGYTYCGDDSVNVLTIMTALRERRYKPKERQYNPQNTVVGSMILEQIDDLYGLFSIKALTKRTVRDLGGEGK